MVRCTHTTLCDKVCQWLAAGLWFSPGTPVSSTNKTDRHNITEILLKVALNTINQTKPCILGTVRFFSKEILYAYYKTKSMKALLFSAKIIIILYIRHGYCFKEYFYFTFTFVTGRTFLLQNKMTALHIITYIYTCTCTFVHIHQHLNLLCISHI